MLISNKHKFIFIHIYKNAGTSISGALKPFVLSKWEKRINTVSKRLHFSAPYNPEPFNRHINASELIKEIGKEAFNSYFSFSIVRNPWDWQVSLYNYMLDMPSHHQYDLVKKMVNFDEYIKWRCENEVMFQKDFIYSKDDELLVNFVGRLENLDTDFEKICSRIGITASLPRLNVHNTKNYQQFYTSETEDLVRRTFRTDIELFGYDF